MRDPLRELLVRLEVGPATLDDDDCRRVPPGGWAALAAAGVLVPTAPAAAVACDACDDPHAGEVARIGGRWHVRCPRFGAVPVADDRVRRWAVVPAAVGRVLTGREPAGRLSGRVWEIGPVAAGNRAWAGWLVAGWRGEAALGERVPELVQPTAAVFVPHALPPAGVWGRSAPPRVVSLAAVLALSPGGLAVDPVALAAHLGRPDPPTAPAPSAPADRPLVPLPPDAAWEDVAVEVDDHHLVVRAAGGEWRVGYESAGFDDGRTGAPDRRWALLQLLAKRGGVLDDGDGKHTKSDRLTRVVSDLRSALCRLTGLTADPFHPTPRGRPYRTRFRIRPTIAHPSDG